MLSKATPLLLTASPKITLHWSDGLLCIHFPYSLYPKQLITEYNTVLQLLYLILMYVVLSGVTVVLHWKINLYNSKRGQHE